MSCTLATQSQQLLIHFTIINIYPPKVLGFFGVAVAYINLVPIYSIEVMLSADFLTLELYHLIVHRFDVLNILMY